MKIALPLCKKNISICANLTFFLKKFIPSCIMGALFVF